ncbi:MAG: hypothetical protein HDR14_00635 [Lachnospiraceae bacterium]|nr:hypothetical protein [Lachnospiraceae bacterium]
MNITFVNPGVDYMMQRIMAFQMEEESSFWSEPLYHFYPQLDKAYAASLPFSERKAYIERILRAVHVELEDSIQEKVTLYTGHWADCKGQITAALSDAFGVDCVSLFNDLRCNVSMNPIEPRFLKERYFDIFYLNSERGAIGECLHEIIHFVWFYVWNRLFADSYDEYERPSLKWILSEMVVESVMRDERLSSINPYFPREHGGCVYPYFFDMKAGGALILDTLDEMYRAQTIEEFMKNSYAYCQEHEAEIRDHIKRSEG